MVNTDNVRDIDATSLARGWNAIQIEERFKAVKSRLHRACAEASQSAMNEARRFRSFFPTRRADQTVALSQFVHLSCATRDNP